MEDRRLLAATLVSATAAGAAGNGPSGAVLGSGEGEVIPIGAAVSADGRWVAFVSDAGNLVGDDANSAPDVFLRDTETGATTLVSVKAGGGGSGNGPSGESTVTRRSGPVISADGRFVAYVSQASDLVADDGNESPDVFRFDRSTGTNALVTVNVLDAGSAGATGTLNGDPAISDDGRFIAFTSTAADLVDYGGGATDPDAAAGADAMHGDVFRRDMLGGTTDLISIPSNGPGGAGLGNAGSPSISNDGRYVAFTSTGTDLVGGFPAGGSTGNVYVRDAQSDATSLASAAVGGTAAGGNLDSREPVISGDGRSVAFLSQATNLVTGFVDGNAEENEDVFVRDLDASGTTLVSASTAAGPTTGGDQGSLAASISDDGLLVAFASNATNLAAPDSGAANADVFVRDVGAGTTQLISVNAAGTTAGNAPSGGGGAAPALSADGRFVAFTSLATDLAAGGAGSDANAVADAYVRDRQANVTRLLSADASNAAAGGVSTVALASGGAAAVFISSAATLQAGDDNGAIDVFKASTTGQVIPPTGGGGGGADLTAEISATLPPSLVAGGKSNAPVTVRVINGGDATAIGKLTIRLFASIDHVVDGADGALASITPKVKLVAGAARSFKIKLGAIPALSNATYDVIAEVAAGQGITEANTGNNVAFSDDAGVHTTIGPPFVDFAAITFTAVPAKAVVPGRRTSATFGIANLGNVTAKGTINVALSAATAANGDGATPLGTVAARLNLKTGTAKRVKLTFTAPAGLAAGAYFLSGTIDAASFGETNVINNRAISTGTFTV